MTIKIRPMGQADRPSLTEILRNTPEFKPFEVVVAEEVIDSYLCDPAGSGFHILVAETDTTVLGYICYGPAPLTEGTWDVYWLAVTRAKQGRGIGSALMESAVKEMNKAQARLAIVETSATPAYEKTIRFYSGHGYEIICQIPDFYAPGDDKVVMQRKLRG